MTTDRQTNLIACEQVSWQRGPATILQDVTFAIAPREIVTVIGPNGAGKTSLVNLVIGLFAPTRGQVRRAPGLQLGYMPQHLRFDTNLPLTVARFLRLATRDQGNMRRYSERLGVSALLDQQLHNLSGGELQRVLLTRAVLQSPQLLVLDEPTQGVDVVGQAELYRHISELRDELGCAVLMVSHDLHLVMAKTDTVLCLNRHICCHGAPESVARHPEYLQLFGRQAQDIAIYTHHHDHAHDLHGDVVAPSAQPHHHHSQCHHS